MGQIGMASIARVQRSLDIGRVLSVVLMTSIYLLFAWSNFLQWRSTDRPVGLGLVIQEAFVAVIFLVGRRPHGTSRSALAWLATGFGTFGLMCLRPHYAPVAGLGALFMVIQMVGVAGSIASLGWLGRSFGFVAANRGVKVNGPYRLVRHPIYASYLIAAVGYLLENPSQWNLAVFLTATAFQLVRIHKEEEFLSTDPAYAAYQTRVRYRLIPFVY